jgi:hypothetical protein
MWRPKRVLPALTAVLILAGPAFGANDQLVRGVYCLEIMKRAIPDWNQRIQEIDRQLGALKLSPSQRADITQAQQRSYQELTDRFNRLRLYVLTNMINMDVDDALALGIAQERGGLDWSRCQGEMQQNAICSYTCTSQRCPSSEPSCVAQCNQQCGLPTCVRIASCVNPTWLPY